MTTPSVSFIVPVYNTEKYLSRCLDSILAQTYNNWEAILINDGSSDASRDICDEYARKDSRIKAIHKKNEGVSNSRNVGIDLACGDWLMFVDSDDEITPNALELLSIGFEDNIDMVIGGYEKIDEFGNNIYSINKKEVLKWDIKTTLRDAYRSQFFTYNGYCANRMFRSSIIKSNHLKFNENIYYREDGLFLIFYLLRCRGDVIFSLESIYKYRQHASNTTTTQEANYNPKRLTSMDSHLLCIQEIKLRAKDKLLLKYAKKALMTSFKLNYAQLKKHKVKDFYYYNQTFIKLFQGINPFQYAYYKLEDLLLFFMNLAINALKKFNYLK